MAGDNEEDFNIARDVDEEEEDQNALSEEVYNGSSDDSSSGGEELLDKFKPKRKRRGRRSTFPDAIIDDMVDIITSNDVYKRKLLYENTKKKANSKFYDEILKTLCERAKDREETCEYNVTQIRNKFKTCVSTCKKVTLTIKTKTGIARFRDEKGFGAWFDKLYPFVKSRDSCQPERAIEPSANNLVEGAEGAAEDTPDENSGETPGTSGGKSTFVPKRGKKAKTDDVLKEMVTTFNKIADKDDTKELLNFMREENEKSRQQQIEMQRMENTSFLKVIRMMMQAPQPQAPSQSYASFYPQGMQQQHQQYPYIPAQSYMPTPLSSPPRAPSHSLSSPPPRATLHSLSSPPRAPLQSSPKSPLQMPRQDNLYMSYLGDQHQDT